MAENWFAVRTSTNGEFKARDEIAQDLGFEVYNPVHRVHTITRGKRLIRTRPLTPGYIFARLSMNHVFMHAIIERKHVEDIIRGCGTWEPQAIPDWAIRILQDIEAGEEIELERAIRGKANVQVGDWVQFMEGLLKGQRMKVANLDGRKRLTVILGGHGTGRPLTVLRSAVEKVAGQDPGASTGLLARTGC